MCQLKLCGQGEVARAGCLIDGSPLQLTQPEEVLLQPTRHGQPGPEKLYT